MLSNVQYANWWNLICNITNANRWAVQGSCVHWVQHNDKQTDYFWVQHISDSWLLPAAIPSSHFCAVLALLTADLHPRSVRRYNRWINVLGSEKHYLNYRIDHQWLSYLNNGMANTWARFLVSVLSVFTTLQGKQLRHWIIDLLLLSTVWADLALPKCQIRFWLTNCIPHLFQDSGR